MANRNEVPPGAKKRLRRPFFQTEIQV